jgi:hypothetical protein
VGAPLGGFTLKIEPRGLWAGRYPVKMSTLEHLREAAAAVAPAKKKIAVQWIKKQTAVAITPTIWWPVQQRIPITLGEEIDAALAEWYGSRGLPIPPEELGAGTEADRQKEEEWKELMRAAALAAGETVTVTDEATGEEKKLEPVGPGPKPEFGTPEFWAWARRKRAFDNAERAKEGLPPLPTAKEKAAAKEARAAAREAKKAAKK